MKRALLALVIVGTAAACTPKRIALPTGAGTSVADAGTPLAQAVAACRSVRTLTAQMRLSGHAGSQRMRGTIIAGFEEPDGLRLEGVAPFGPPAFILVSQGGRSTLVLPRDDRVLNGASATDILDALSGVRLGPSALRALVSGCVVTGPQASSARSFPDGWLVVDVVTHGPEAADTPTAVVYLRQQAGQWQIVAGQVGTLRIEYQQFEGGLPHLILLSSNAGGAASGRTAPLDDAQGAPPLRQAQDRPEQGRGASVDVDLALALSQVAVNTSLDPAAFQVAVPPNATPLTLAELRRAGPLSAK